MAKLIPLCLLILFMDFIPSTLGWFNYYSRSPPRTIPYPPYLHKPMVHRPPRSIPVAQPPLPPLVGPKPPHSHVMTPLPPIVMPPIPPKHQLPFPPLPPQTILSWPPPSPPSQMCPVDTIKLLPCINLLGGVSRIGIGIGHCAKVACCPMLRGITDHDAALCLCTGAKAKSLNMNLVTPAALGLLVGCGKHPPPGFQCPA